MPTTDERREIAARLRSVSGAPEWATTACCIAECLGEHDYPLWNDSKPLFKRLADLIEPEERTCRVVNEKSIDLNEHGFTVGCLTVCNLSCGHVTFCANWKPERPKRCSECGAKVVDE